jgi:AAA+ ATPase superfamily predicted ATPase
MRYFNTSGPCNPKEHYTVMRPALIAKGKLKVERGRFFAIFAPRQAGKTTYFQLLVEELKKEGNYTPIWISFESLKTATRAEFYEYLNHVIWRELAAYNVKFDHTIKNQLHVELFFEQLRRHTKPMLLVIDEFEGIPDIVLSELMHAFRQMYHQKQNYGLQALILVGVSTVAELVVSSASPFNVVDELQISYFTFAEVSDLIGQYVAESGQQFEPEVIEAIYNNTNGQPGLVCALAGYLVEEVVTDPTRPVTMADFYKTLNYFLTGKFDKNIINIVQKAREKIDFMLKLLFTEQEMPFSVHDPDIAYLYAHGVIDKVGDNVDVFVPLYSKALITAFRPLFNGETPYYVSAHDTFSEYVTPDGLNIAAILNRYREYVRRRGFRAFDIKQLKESAWHYSLDGFINFFIDILGGQTFIEVPSGRGRTDILILYQEQKYIIETKIFTNNAYFERGKRQLAEYLDSEGVAEGYYVVFSQRHTEEDELHFEEEVDGKMIHTYLIRTHFERASDVSA